MKTSWTFAALPLLVAGTAWAAGPSGMMGGGMMNGGGMMGGSVLRHQYVRSHGLDKQYAVLKNPLFQNAYTVAAGQKLYTANCLSCHGTTGGGDGPAATALKPVPANLGLVARGRIGSDGYLYWTIAEGGAPVGSAMPAFKASLKPEQIWQLISYLRTLPED